MAHQRQTEQAQAALEEARQEATARARDLVEQARHTAAEVSDRATEALQAAAAKFPHIDATGLVHEGQDRVHEVVAHAQEATRAAGHRLEEVSGLVREHVPEAIDRVTAVLDGGDTTDRRRAPVLATVILIGLVLLVIWLMRRR
jgi:hypothetical protein